MHAAIVGILQPSYLPWLGFFEQLDRADIFVYYDDVQFEKGGWRNRNRIKTAHGPLMLTVPVLAKGSPPSLIKDIRINNAASWQKKHIESIRQNYSKAPFFALYAPELFSIINAGYDFLLDLNLALLAWLVSELGIQTRTVLSSTLGIGGGSTERLVAIVSQLGGNTFYEGAAGRNYIDERLFAAAAINLIYQDYKHPEYTQLHGDFVSYLSVIDLLFNHGPESMAVIRRGMS